MTYVSDRDVCHSAVVLHFFSWHAARREQLWTSRFMKNSADRSRQACSFSLFRRPSAERQHSSVKRKTSRDAETSMITSDAGAVRLSHRGRRYTDVAIYRDDRSIAQRRDIGRQSENATHTHTHTAHAVAPAAACTASLSNVWQPLSDTKG